MHNHPRYSIRNILVDNNNWEKYKLFHKELREEQIREVDNMLLCNNPSKGFFYYYCDKCDEHILRHFCCNSRICDRCGVRYVNRWAEKTVKRMLNVNHSHVVFTLPDRLWLLIKDNWACIKELSATTFTVMKETMNKVAKEEVIPGMICSLQTYGKDIGYNVHFHTIITEGGVCKNKQWKTIYYFPYDIIRKKWKEYVLRVVAKYVDKNMYNQIILESAYYDYKNGFNFRRIKGKVSKKELVGYIARYVRHPAISNRRIVDYNGKEITIVCENKEKGTKWYVTYSIDEFITKLVSHIPKKNFKVIRYYGIYSRKYVKKEIKKDKQESITKYFRSKHSINCPYCNKILEPLYYFPNAPPSNVVFGERIVDWC